MRTRLRASALAWSRVTLGQPDQQVLLVRPVVWVQRDLLAHRVGLVLQGRREESAPPVSLVLQGRLARWAPRVPRGLPGPLVLPVQREGLVLQEPQVQRVQRAPVGHRSCWCLL